MTRKTKSSRDVSLILAARLGGVVPVSALVSCLLGRLIHANVALQRHQTTLVATVARAGVVVVESVVAVSAVGSDVVAASVSDGPPIRAHRWW